MESFKLEWAAHNAQHTMGVFWNWTEYKDLNWPQPWFIRLGYALIGTIVWQFIK